MSYSLRVKIIEYDEVAKNLRKGSYDGHENILFVAEQLQFSDDQVNNVFYVILSCERLLLCAHFSREIIFLVYYSNYMYILSAYKKRN